MQEKLYLYFKIEENHFWSYTFQLGYRGKKYKLLLSTFRNNSTPSKQKINELLKTYPKDLFNFDYLEQCWVFDVE